MVADEIQELRDRDDLPEIREQLEAKPNVYATGIGYRRQGGERTDEPAIIASVYPKVDDESELEDDEIIPEEINGVRVDVHGLEREPTEERAESRNSELRPIPGGSQLASTGTLGTFGLPVRDTSNGTPLMMTAAHTPYQDTDSTIDDVIGTEVYQPSTDSANLVGTVYDAEYDPLDSTEQDWATVEFDDTSWITNEVLGVGQMGSYREPTFDQPLVISGRSSSANGLRKAELVAVDVMSTGGRGPSLEYTDVTETGDSGSVIGQFDANGMFRPAALHFAGGSFGLMLDNILNNRRSEYELITGSADHSVPDYTATGAYFEAAVIQEDHGTATVDVSVWNGGGEYGTTYVETLEEDGTVVDTVAVAIEPMDWRVVELEIPRSGDYRLQTRDVEHPYDSRTTESTVAAIDEYGPGVYVVRNGEIEQIK